MELEEREKIKTLERLVTILIIIILVLSAILVSERNGGDDHGDSGFVQGADPIGQ
jgi:hypothetical protein